ERELASNQPHHSHAGSRFVPPAIDDLAYLNRDSEAAIRRWAPLPPDRKEAIEAQARRDVRQRDGFVTIPFPEIASASKRQLVQDLRSQLAEEARRQQDMSAALLVLDRAMQAYQPYMGLSADEMKARLEHARGDERERLANLVDGAWVGVKLYNRLTPAERAA